MHSKIDLHIHTTFSDGTLTSKEIIDEAYNNGVDTIAIADHDTIEAYNDSFYQYAKSKNIKIVNAVEISTKIDKCGIHVLGYDFDIDCEELKKKLHLLRNARHDYLYNVAVKLNELGYFLNVSELDTIEAVTKAHIALDVISNQQNENLLLKTFYHLPSKGEFIETIMNEGCPAYVRKETITPVEAAELIRKANGKVVLAHPVAYQYEDGLSDEDILALVKEMKADGIEANYIYIDRNNNKINDTEKWNTIAQSHDLIATIGSDFHAKDGIHPLIGLIDESVNLNAKILTEILVNLVK